MDIFGRVADIVLAFICMFLLPFMVFRTELKNISSAKALNEARVFLDRIETGGAITAEQLSELCMNDGTAVAGRICEAEIVRTEYFPGVGECTVRFSPDEVCMLLDKYGMLPLRRGDTVTVRIYGHTLFGSELTLLAVLSVTL